jgi:2'-5' RNA ligase
MPRSLRLFFALWPNAATRDAIGTLAQEVVVETGGRAVTSVNIHLTLAFLGEQPEHLVNELGALAAAVATPIFDIKLDELGCWRKSGIAWLGASTTPQELAALEQSVVRALATLGLEGDERPFSAHITLARRIVRPLRPRAVAPIEWRIDSFALVASDAARDGRTYRVLASWALGNR